MQNVTPQSNTMSAVTSQPLPFDRLEREQHIQMIFRAFRNRCGPACEFHGHSPESKLHHALHWGSDDPLSSASVRVAEHPPSPASRREAEDQQCGAAAASCFISMLETVEKIHITTRSEVQGPQCVPRRIYSITTGGSSLQLVVAVEETSCVCLQCCGPARACSLQGFDCQGRQVFFFERPLRVDACCLGCCLMEMRAYAQPRGLIGTVRQRWSMLTPLLEVCDTEGESTFRIQGSCCPCRCSSNQQFQVVSNIGEEVGTIWKRWPGFSDERNMDHDFFGLEVPVYMEPQTKLLLLAATFLLNHMFFEMS